MQSQDYPDGRIVRASNMKRGVRVTSCNIDNFDENDETFVGKNTVHYLLIVGFQRRYGSFESLKSKLEETTSLTLPGNTFGELLPCEEVSNRQLKQKDGCTNANCLPGYTES